MGRGNWVPCGEENYSDIRYFDLEERYEGEEDFCATLFMEDIREALPPSFWELEGLDSEVSWLEQRGDNKVLFRNGLVALVVDCESYNSHVGIAWVSLDSWPGLSDYYIERLSKAFWRALGGNQRVRTSAWTSALVNPSEGS